MSLINLAAQLFIGKLGSQGEGLAQNSVVQALLALLPTQQGELDLGALVAQFSGNDALASLASSWLGGGTNAALTPATLLEILGSAPVAEFARALGLTQNSAVDGLTQMIPELIDNNSNGGALLGDAVGSLAKGMLGKLF